jgi:MFS family permease
MSDSVVSKRNYALVTAAYWAFTLTDGALRMLVLLHFHELGFSPFSLALLFTLYEFFGIVTNLGGGFLASRIGLKSTLVAGLFLQMAALAMLSGLSPHWAVSLQVVYVVAAQGFSGIAKDLTKLSAKSAVKLVLPGDAQEGLFKWVALLTGSKNTLKGVGFFLGGALLQAFGFVQALWGMALVLLPVGLAAWAGLPATMGKAKARKAWRQLLAKDAAINYLSAARVFLFGARDVWFVVALPVFLHERLEWSFWQVGAYMAAWVIVYGVVQAGAPRVLRQGAATGAAAVQTTAQAAQAASSWGLALALSPLAIVGVLLAGAPIGPTVLVGLAVFGVLFAVNSSLHSYLILAFSTRDEVAADVGFYYMANAAGRLLGTLLSGLVYGAWGLEACLLTAGGMLLLATGLTRGLPLEGGDSAYSGG